ncbi:MAG: hypothetical protein LBE86_07945, partial [Gemmobacter sp.]|nr:hypothetical protein [Gemmobacter sp.]
MAGVALTAKNAAPSNRLVTAVMSLEVEVKEVENFIHEKHPHISGWRQIAKFPQSPPATNTTTITRNHPHSHEKTCSRA